MSDSPEIMLAQEQSVLHKTGLLKEVQGTLILTNKKLVFVAANQEIDFKVAYWPVSGRTVRFRFADVDELKELPPNQANLSVPLEEVEVERGEERFYEGPRLKIRWRDGGVERKEEFIGDVSGTGRSLDLKDWARVIDSIKAATIHIEAPKVSPPSKDTLEGKALYILGDLQDKGMLEIEEQVEEYFKVELEPEDVEAACDQLVALGLVDRVDSDSGDSFYRKHSPLGQDDLSS